MSDQGDESEEPLLHRRDFTEKAILGFSITGLLGIAWGERRENERYKESVEQFRESADEGIENTVKELESSQHDNFNTDSGDINVDQSYGNIRVDVELDLKEDEFRTDLIEDDPEDVAGILTKDDYISEGAEIFGVMAENLYDVEHLEDLELGYNSEVLDDEIYFNADVDELRSWIEDGRSGEEFYRENIESRLEY